MNKQLKASFMISLMLITLVSAVFNVNAISDSNRMYVLKSDNPPIANFTIKNDNARGCVVFNGFSSYDIDGYIVLYDWDYGDGNTFNSSISGWGFNQYCDDETYNVTLTVTDNDGLTGNLTKSVDIILANLGPPSVEIDGPDSGNAGAEYDF